jgi:excisionase family DNA binding protein
MSIVHNNEETSDTEELLTITRAASILKVDRGWLSKLVDRGEIGSLAVGSHRRIPRWALRKWQERKLREVESLVKATRL